MSAARWEHCVNHRGRAADAFIRDYFGNGSQQIGLIAGAGFDPRATLLAETLASAAHGRVFGFFLREDRPAPDARLLRAADNNVERLKKALPECTVDRFDVFHEADSAPVGSRRAMELLRKNLKTDNLTDLVIDCSGLSVGVSYSIIRYCYELSKSSSLNLHLTVYDHPATDGAIRAIHSGQQSSPHGFQGSWRLEKWSKAAKLWMPQLGRGKRLMLEEVYKYVTPHAVCPILPFPASSPRFPDTLIEEYGEFFEGSWQVDARDLIYAAEKSPLDLYRAILRIDDARIRLFEATGGSQVILSPAGSKALALGMLMAALERDFAVVLIESLTYEVDPGVLEISSGPCGELVHIWLHMTQ